MPGRAIPLVTGEYYHVLNRGITGQLVYPDHWAYQKFRELVAYYQYVDVPLRYSQFLSLGTAARQEILANLKKRHEHRVQQIAFCLMPSHFHLLLRQERDTGISRFLNDLTNSFTRAFNTKHDRQGPLFQGAFKAVRVENDEQLLHVVRYIHLNPHTSYVVKTIEELMSYRYSSLPEYLSGGGTLVDPMPVLEQFSSLENFKIFTFDQADYQRTLDHCKHLTLERDR
jgi:putative transposase